MTPTRTKSENRDDAPAKGAAQACAGFAMPATKGQMLDHLRGHCLTAHILPSMCFTVAQWLSDRQSVMARLRDLAWSQAPVIVRSSALCEDSAIGSHAGHFLSVLGLSGDAQIIQAVDDVVESYARHPDPHNEILIQPMLDQPAISGVAFSCDPSHWSPYFVINYEIRGDTTAVTSGTGLEELHTFICARSSPYPAPPPFDAVIAMMAQLETILDCPHLDVEFAFDQQGRLYLFQVRPLVRNAQIPPFDADLHRRSCQALANQVEHVLGPRDGLCGRRGILGIMPDWNPAEIIGLRPRPLAMALYADVVTDRIWAEQRRAYGYRDVVGQPLMHSLNGLPYIDVRASLNSFIPATIPDDMAHRLVEHYIERLIDKPELHDKIEFDLAITSYSFDLPQRLDALLGAGFSADQHKMLEKALHALTWSVMRPGGLADQDWRRIAEMDAVRPHQDGPHRDAINGLLDQCRQGTLAFAGLARSAFMAMQFLHSMVRLDLLSQDQAAGFMGGLNIISTDMRRDLTRLDRDSFLGKYGHLRPGTYDILSPRYDEAPDCYFDWSDPLSAPSMADPEPFQPDDRLRERIDRHLAQHDFPLSCDAFLTFLGNAIRGREYAKFVFTRFLSAALSRLEQWGLEQGLNRDELSFLPLDAVRMAAGLPLARVGQSLRKAVEDGRAAYDLTARTTLPPLISDPKDIWAFQVPPCTPNFVTIKRVTGSITSADQASDLTGKIVMIPNADPGFDWIFSRGINGFITAFGGVNSHMSVRAAELQMPAVIGAGELLFNKWNKSRILEIDCAARLVRILQ